MDFSKIPGKIFFINKFINSKNAKVHVLNHSLHFSASVFEGIGVYNSKPLFLSEHLDRLFVSSKMMKLDLNFSKKKLSDISNKLIRINKIKDGYIRPIVFRSSNSMSPETKNCKTYLAIAAWKWGTLFNNPRGIFLLQQNILNLVVMFSDPCKIIRLLSGFCNSQSRCTQKKI